MIGKLIALAGIGWLATRPAQSLNIGDRVRTTRANTLRWRDKVGTITRVEYNGTHVSVDISDPTGDVRFKADKLDRC